MAKKSIPDHQTALEKDDFPWNKYPIIEENFVRIKKEATYFITYEQHMYYLIHHDNYHFFVTIHRSKS